MAQPNAAGALQGAGAAPASPPPTSPPPGPPAKRRGRGWRIAGVVLLVLVLLLAAVASAVWWAVRTEGGSTWLLTQVPGVQVEAPTGSLLGGDFGAQRLVVQLPGSSDTVTLTDFAWRGLDISRAPSPQWLRIVIDELRAQRIDVVLAPGAKQESAPLQAPENLKLPVEVDLRSLKVGELHATPLGDKPVRNIDAKLHVGADGGALHRIDRLKLAFDQLDVDAKAQIASAAPMALSATVDAGQPAAGAVPAWRATAALDGPLAEPVLQATVRVSPAGERPPQSLDARATLKPFAPWPLGDLQASAKALDLSAFAAAAPKTELSLEANATSTGADQPAQVKVDLTNALAGRYDEGRLPLRSARLEIAARPDQPSVLEIKALDADLGGAKASAGRISSSGRYTPDKWNLDAKLAALQPARLDARAPAMQLSGPLTVAGGTADDGKIDAKLNLTGELSEGGKTRPLKLQLDASANPQRVELRELQASAGKARASVSGTATQADADAPWLVKAKGTLAAFDPGVWIPGEASPWRKARNDVNGKFQVDLAVPAQKPDQAVMDLVAALRGSAEVNLDDTVLAGVPLRGDAKLRAAGDGHASVALNVDAAGNAVKADGRIATAGAGASDAIDVVIDAGALARLEPVFKLFQPAGADTTLAGTLKANAQISGRWPTVSTKGTLAVDRLRVGTLGLRKADARWTLGSSASAPVEADVTLSQLTLAPSGAAAGSGKGAGKGRKPEPGPSLESATLKLSGTGRAHALELRAESKVLPPAWVENTSGSGGAAPAKPAAAANARTVARLRAKGGLVDQGGAELAGWRGTLQSLEVRSSTAGSAPLVSTSNVGVEALWAGGPPRVTVQPGRAEILSAALRWSRIAWQGASGAGASGRIEADAQLEPLRIAPLLAQVQPDFGWGGGLAIGGRIKIRSTPRFDADIVIERSAGDLTITDELGTRALDLTDLRAGLNADNGVWNFTLALAGKTLGVASGAVVVRTEPTALWPAASAPIDGVLEVRIADLGSLSTWVPPGWRVEGAVRANASIGGRFGAPQYTGEIVGSKLAVRNFLEGIKVTDGDVAIRLKGETAQIERFTAKGGDGSIKLEGGAEFGASPTANLTLTADHFLLLGRVDRKVVVSGGGKLRMDSKTLAFDGKFGVDEGLIDAAQSNAPQLSDDVTVVRAEGVPSPQADASAAASPKPTATPVADAATPQRDVRLDLSVSLGKKLFLRGFGLTTRLEGDLRITAPEGQLAINGTVRTVDGEFQAYGQELKIDRGVIVFNGPVANPRLDIEATRPKTGDVRVGVTVTGMASNPRIRLFSEPEMSEVDKLSWLVMGRASDALGSTETALLQRAALALVSGEGPGVTDQITKSLGLDELSLGQTTNNGVKSTVVTVGKKISDRLYLGYEQGLNAAGGSFQLLYKIAQRFTLRAQSGTDNSLDLIWTFRWQ